MFELLERWDGEEVAVHFDRDLATWMFVCVHSTRLGPACGGTRMKSYAEPGDALRDGLRLSGAMTAKNAVAGLPLGGGKAVLAVPEILQGDRRRELFLRYGDLVCSLGGTYVTACDMNTSERDMDVVGERCSHVFGRSVARGGSGSSAPATATGVFHGIRASVAHAFGSSDLGGRTVLVQGVGSVGRSLARQLGQAGARLLVTDVDRARAVEVAEALGSEIVAPEDATRTACDVFSPNATGATLSSETIPELRCRIVAGAANNQLARPEDAELFGPLGILYAPDYVINAGGIIHLASLELFGEDEAQRDERLLGIGEALTEVFEAAAAENLSTGAAAERIVERRLAAAA
ncbi:MAG TPA: Glu/Leu/Phe/Val dehydrogenase dimerization domain-containing protein [Actinomycetota bacterium]|nr:Glu/Leu/Phe/Val dehydrogenase dimerization domain-containing protein [Actinomycetota bacterium]